MIQVAVLVGSQLEVDLAAREGARAAAVSATPGPAASHAVSQVIPDDRATVHVDVSAATVTVTVTAPVSATLPLVGAVVADRTLTASVTMSIEPPDDR